MCIYKFVLLCVRVHKNCTSATYFITSSKRCCYSNILDRATVTKTHKHIKTVNIHCKPSYCFYNTLRGLAMMKFKVRHLLHILENLLMCQLILLVGKCMIIECPLPSVAIKQTHIYIKEHRGHLLAFFFFCKLPFM